MVRIAISAEPFEAIARTLALGSVGYGNAVDEHGNRLVWLDRAIGDRLRALAVRMLDRWDEIDAWRTSLSPHRQHHLNNPREVRDAYLDHRKKLGDPGPRSSAPAAPAASSRPTLSKWKPWPRRLRRQPSAPSMRATTSPP
jgi:hypothetical protein